uniref:Apple domain-containing protein n=1 Tax=Plectus sambesii TaxID=2011161 RepID=A0A914VVW6_9BILA
MVTSSHVRILLFSFVASASSKRAIGVLRTPEDWHYLERFCFVSEVGNLYYDLQYPVNFSPQKLYLYYDSASQWPAVYDSGQTCVEKEAHLHISNNQILNLSLESTDQHNEPVCRVIVRENNENWLKCVGNRKFILIFESVSLFFDSAAYGRYAQDGIGMPTIKLFGQLFRAAGTITFLYLLILLAKGYTISRGRLSKSASWKLMVLMSSFIISYCALFVWQIRIFDPAKVTYLFESYPGYGLIALRIFAWVWFCNAAYMTLSRYPEKRGFYLAFLATFTLWFWMGPVSIIIANHVLDDWVREKVVNGVENAVALYGFGVFLFLTRPSAANTNFPFHVRTTQIGAMPLDEIASFPHNAYEVRYSTRQDEAFTVPSAPPMPKPFDPRDSPTSTEPLNRLGDAPPTYQEARAGNNSGGGGTLRLHGARRIGSRLVRRAIASYSHSNPIDRRSLVTELLLSTINSTAIRCLRAVSVSSVPPQFPVTSIPIDCSILSFGIPRPLPPVISSGAASNSFSTMISRLFFAFVYLPCVLASRCFYLPNISLQGGTYDEFYADEIKHCCIACTRDQCCIAYTFADGKCFLKSAIGESHRSEDDEMITSGIKANSHGGQQSELRNVAIEGSIITSVDAISGTQCQSYCTAYGIYTWTPILSANMGSCSCISRIASVQYQHGARAGIFPPIA